MNTENLKEKYPLLITYLENKGYSKTYIGKVRSEIRRILINADKNDWKSYNDVYQDYVDSEYPQRNLRHKRTYLGIIEHFEVDGHFPNGRRRQQIVRRDAYHKLTEEFKAVIDFYRNVEKKRGKKDTTIYGESNNASTFLQALQEKGIETLQSITEDSVLSVFIGADGKLRRSCSYKKNVAAVFKACIPQNPDMFERILSFFPTLRETRKNIQYLRPEEINSIKNVLDDADTPITLRDRAIGTLIMNTGLRCCDIAGMTLASINWDNDTIILDQQKTDVPLSLPLMAVVGNAVYDYLMFERPNIESEYIFLTENKPYRNLESGSVGNIADKLLAVAVIRQSNGDRRGFHIFRHRLATTLLGNGVARPVISQILGHDSPDSLDTYLSADFVHLKECALSIDRYPIGEGVLTNA